MIQVPEAPVQRTKSTSAKTSLPQIVKSVRKQNLGKAHRFFHANSAWIFNENVIDTEAIEENSIESDFTIPHRIMSTYKIQQPQRQNILRKLFGI
jgi:hypothetical protein